MERRILFTDLDGTLLDDQKNITPENQAAIDEALALGHIIVISTGRPLASALIQAERLGLTKSGCYAITYNGAQIYDMYNHKTVYGKGLPREIAAPLFQAAQERDLQVRKYSEVIKIPYEVIDDISEALTEDPYKLIAINFDDHQKLLDYQSEVLSAYAGTLDSFFSNDAYLEIVPTGISKGFAVHWMCEHLGIPLENSVAAGDAQNDIAMLEAAHIGAVMCNAFPGIAEHGNYVTKADNNHDGVAEIIHRFILKDM